MSRNVWQTSSFAPTKKVMKVQLEKILSVSGKPGLFRVITGGKAAIIAESLIDGKRQPILSSQRVSSLADISMFTIEEDVPLREVLLKVKEAFEGGQGPDPKSDQTELKKAMKKVLPTYDEERVYVSDIRKLFQWYNLLQSKDMLEFEELESGEEQDGEVS